MKEENPINNVRFYCKDDLTKAIQICKNQVRTEDHLIQILIFLCMSFSHI